MPQLQFCLLGKFTVLCNQQFLSCFQVQKVQELLCYLLLHRNRLHNRELLADVLWNDAGTAYTRKYLRKTLWQLQAALDTLSCSSTAPLLLVDPQWIQLNRDGEFSLDIAIFEETFASLKGRRGRDLNSKEFEDVQQVVQLYKGDLLEGWFQDWCVYNRERYREMFLVMVDKLMGYCEVTNKHELGIEFGKIILGYDRARERTHQRIMQLYYLVGDRTAALRQFETCKNSLREELGVEPSHSTFSLYEQIVQDDLPFERATMVQANESQRKLVSERINQRLRRIENLEKVLLTIQERIIKELREIEHELKGQP